MNSNIKFWYEYTFKQAQQVQLLEQDNNDVDGRAIWKQIEMEVDGVNITGLNYKDELKEIFSKMTNLINKYKMEESEYKPKSNHFFMQLKNLVDKKSNFEIKLNRLLQIAYNAGQLSVFISKKLISDELIDFINENNLLDLNTYVSKENQKIINEKYLDNTPLDKIRENINNLGGGGNDQYYLKYLKYKTKYLNLKSKKLNF